MLKLTVLQPCFVKGVPRELEPGVLYVSMEYGTVVHSCCCGCGLEVVTPPHPDGLASRLRRRGSVPLAIGRQLESALPVPLRD
jgi:hypothetical protein